MILVDPPVWPAHGTHFGHLVSDESLDELHAFARRAGLHPRAFDHDHYDAPAARYDDLVAAGAVPVTSGVLLRRLIASGLRMRPAERTPTRRRAIGLALSSWESLAPAHPALRDELLARWGEPHRLYHDVRHLAAVLEALDALEVDDRLVRLAAWFHDAVHDGAAGHDEAASGDLAREALTGVLSPGEAEEVARLVLVTTGHDPDPGDAPGAALVDADLAVLGQRPGRYHVYARDVRLEYGGLDDDTFAAGRTAVLEHLLGRQRLYRTPTGGRLWADAARDNMTAEITRLAER